MPLDLQDAEQTLLGPLHARAIDAGQPLSLLRDRMSAEIASRIEFDFRTLLPPGRTAVVRTQIFDTVARAFMSDHPTATVVDVGSGLNTRFERIDNGTVRWFDVDQPRVAALRRRLLRVSGRRMHVAGSILEDGWLELVATTPGPHCFLFEAVLGYLPCPEVRPLLERIARRFTGATILFDVHPRWSVDRDGDLHMSAKSSAPTLFTKTIPAAIDEWSIGARITDTIPFLGHSPCKRRAGRFTLQPQNARAGQPRMVIQLRAT